MNIKRILVVGILVGIISNALLFILFSNSISAGILFGPLQSQKLIDVWQNTQPLPLMVANPALMFIGLVLITMLHALVFAWIYDGIPGKGIRKGVNFGIILWIFQALFFEFFTPFNLLGEPVFLVAFELTIWFIVLATEGILISRFYSPKTSK